MSITIPLFNNLPNSATQTESQYNAAWDDSLGTFNAYGAALNALGAQVEQYALDAASAVAALPNAKWVAGTYADGDVRWSPTDYQDYRNKGSGTRNTDPALDPTNWVPRIRTGNGGADTTSSAVDITLTSSSGRLQIISMTAAGKKVFMPAASTLTKGAPVFVLKNAGNYRVSLHKNGGGFICYLLPGQVIALHCSDTGSSAGVWQVSGAEIHNIYSGNNAEVLNVVDSRNIAVTMLSATQAICAFRNDSTTYLNAVVLNFGSASGAPVAVNAESSVDISVAAQTSVQATVVYKTSAGVTKGYVLDVSGNAITPGAVATIDSVTGGGGTAIAPLSSNQLLCVYIGTNSSTPKERILDIVSSAINPSAEVVADATNSGNYFLNVEKITASKALVVFRNASGFNVRLRLQSITGSTPAPTGSVLDLSIMPGTNVSSVTGVVVMSANRAVVMASVDRTYADVMIALIDISGTTPALLSSKFIRVNAVARPDFYASKLDDSGLYMTWTGGGGFGVDCMLIKITSDDQILPGKITENTESNVASGIRYYLGCAALDSSHVMQVCRNKDSYLSAKVLEISAL